MSEEGAPPDVVIDIARAVERFDDELVSLARQLYEYPELGFEEVRSVEAIAALLKTHEIDAQVGAYGLPTAFYAECGSAPGPCVAVVAEYDALPEIGHGCGHNLIAASAVGAFLALRDVALRSGGRVRLVGTPAEENGGGKELILRAGGFDDVDAAIMVHPGNEDVADPATITGRRSLDVTYYGKPAHAATEPHLGRNALDAAVLAYQAIAQLRQHMTATDRLHAIITEGGQAVNIVPERAAMSLFVRSATAAALAELSQRVADTLRGTALATGTECDISWDPTPPYLPLRTNQGLARRYAAALTGSRDVRPSMEVGEGGGSTDMGNVSHWVPAIQPMIAFAPREVPGHSAELAQLTVSPAADRAIHDGAVALARVCADYLCDPDLRASVHEEFVLAGGQVRAGDVFATTPN